MIWECRECKYKSYVDKKSKLYQMNLYGCMRALMICFGQEATTCKR